jgi:hypothetical protein
MNDTFEVHLKLTIDSPNCMNFLDTYDGLDNPWYRFTTDGVGNVTLLANPEGFEHLARFFLKMARTNKGPGYHSHHSLEFGKAGYPRHGELTIGIGEDPGADEQA